MISSQVVIPMPPPAFERVATVTATERTPGFLRILLSCGAEQVGGRCKDDEAEVDALIRTLAAKLAQKLSPH